jgi:STE24 endopeptidase
MNVLFLVALALALSFDLGPIDPPAQVGLRLLAMALGVLAVVASAHSLSNWVIRRLHQDFTRRFRILGRYQLLRKLHGFFSLIIFAALILFGRWNSVVSYEWGFEGWIIINELLGIAPYLIAETLALWSYYDVDQAIRTLYGSRGKPQTPAWSRREYVSFQFRSQFGIWLVTSLMITALKDIVRWALPAFAPRWMDSTIATTILFGGMAIGVLLVSPWILRVVWGAHPLPAGPLRKLLDDLSRSLKFRCSNILVWQTHGGVANAAISGVVPNLRYVLLSDALVDHLRPEEIVSVYGHEVGHIKHHHLWYYFGFIAASLIFIVQVAQSLQILIHHSVSLETWRSLAPVFQYAPLEIILLIPYIVIVFGYLSRRCERQADLYGSRATSQALLAVVGPSAALDNPYRNDDLFLVRPSRTVGDSIAEPRTESASVVPPSPAVPVVDAKPSRPPPQPTSHPPLLPDGIRIFVASLERVAMLNGMTRGLWTWRHGSIAQRVEFLEAIGRDPTLADRYDRSMRRLRWGMALALGGGILGLAFVVPLW